MARSSHRKRSPPQPRLGNASSWQDMKIRTPTTADVFHLVSGAPPRTEPDPCGTYSSPIVRPTDWLRHVYDTPAIDSHSPYTS